jgi:hypothetical protein
MHGMTHQDCRSDVPALFSLVIMKLWARRSPAARTRKQIGVFPFLMEPLGAHICLTPKRQNLTTPSSLRSNLHEPRLSMALIHPPILRFVSPPLLPPTLNLAQGLATPHHKFFDDTRLGWMGMQFHPSPSSPPRSAGEILLSRLPRTSSAVPVIHVIHAPSPSPCKFSMDGRGPIPEQAKQTPLLIGLNLFPFCDSGVRCRLQSRAVVCVGSRGWCFTPLTPSFSSLDYHLFPTSCNSRWFALITSSSCLGIGHWQQRQSKTVVWVAGCGQCFAPLSPRSLPTTISSINQPSAIVASASSPPCSLSASDRGDSPGLSSV